MAWKDVCTLKSEGGLGVRPLKEVNMTHGLKIIWRLLSEKTSLWGQWIRMNLTKKKSFWEISGKTQQGSWMWKKILKLRDIAKTFHMKDIGNGRNTSLWFDQWTDMGQMSELLGDRGIIDLDIPRESNVAEAFTRQRPRRRHRTVILQEVEKQIMIYTNSRRENMQDTDLWRRRSGFKKRFSNHETWLLCCQERTEVDWDKGIWFSHCTPKFSFMIWLAMLNKLSTLDRVATWNRGTNPTCVLCSVEVETRDHLFFKCSYSTMIWEKLVKGIMKRRYSDNWSFITNMIVDSGMEPISTFCFRYSFQCALYTVWFERNRRRHGDNPRTAVILATQIDKSIRNRLSLLSKSGDKRYGGALGVWFGFR